MTKLVFGALLACICLHLPLVNAQIVVRNNSGSLKKIQTPVVPNTMLKGAGTLLVDSILSDTRVDGQWVYDLYQVNYYNAQCLLVKDSVAIDFWDNGEWRPSFIEQYFYGNDVLLDEWLDIGFGSDNGVPFFDSSHTVYYYDADGLLQRSKFERRQNGQWDSVSYAAHFYDANNVLVYTMGGQNDIFGEIYYKSVYAYDANSNLVEEIASVSDSPDGPFEWSNRSTFQYNAQNNPISNADYYWEDGQWKQGELIEYHYDAMGLLTNYLYQAANNDGVLEPFSRGQVFARYGCESSSSGDFQDADVQVVMANPFPGGRVALEGDVAGQSGLVAEIRDVHGRLLQCQPMMGGQANFQTADFSGLCLLLVWKDGRVVMRRKIVVP